MFSARLFFRSALYFCPPSPICFSSASFIHYLFTHSFIFYFSLSLGKNPGPVITPKARILILYIIFSGLLFCIFFCSFFFPPPGGFLHYVGKPNCGEGNFFLTNLMYGYLAKRIRPLYIVKKYLSLSMSKTGSV